MKIDTPQGKAIKAFEVLGFQVVANREHIKLRNEGGTMISLPNHRKLKGSTLSRICRDAGIDKNAFFKLV